MATPVASLRGTRSRAGNAMGRAREATLTGAVRAVAKYGSRKATMGDIAMIAGVAKATLYNHFRTRDDVYAAAIDAEVDAIAAAAIAQLPAGLEAAIGEAARRIAEHPAVRRIAVDEPAVLAALATPGTAAGWARTRAHVAGALQVAGRENAGPQVELVVRYLASLLLSPSDDLERTACARLLSEALACEPITPDGSPPDMSTAVTVG
jgi:AcrR family transcriptional regulator